MTYYTTTQSPPGEMLLVATDTGLKGVYIKGQKYFPKLDGDAKESPRQEWLLAAKNQLKEYFAKKRNRFDIKLDPTGTPFQRSVWNALLTIPFGKTRTYGQLAAQLGDSNKTRAVASAIGRNPIGIIVPCHRVIGSNGSLTGFAAGLECKRSLLELEGSLQPTLY